MSMLWILGGFLAAILGSELVLHGTKLQTGLFRIVAIQAVILAVVAWTMLKRGDIGIVIVLAFWTGAFLTWFTVRSHIESSILLRMLYLLKQNALTKEELLDRYESYYGQVQRLQELVRAGLVSQTPEGIVPTLKGTWILRIVSLLR